jgi:glycerol-3-phosphate dehydrogenase (NAD(P)+)
MVLAGSSDKNLLKKEIESEKLYIETSDDFIGVEVGAALKNVMAIFIGIMEGYGYGQNANAFIFTKTVQEIKKIGIILGGQPDTFFGLSCVGDLTLVSRNRCLGIELGKGRKLEEITREMNYNPEGIFALKNAKVIIEKLNIEAPITKLLYKILFENYPVKDVLKEIR